MSGALSDNRALRPSARSPATSSNPPSPTPGREEAFSSPTSRRRSQQFVLSKISRARRPPRPKKSRHLPVVRREIPPSRAPHPLPRQRLPRSSGTISPRDPHGRGLDVFGRRTRSVVEVVENKEY